MDSALTSTFRQQVRPLLDLVDQIRNSGLEDQDAVSVPKITIVGDQSSGKSSVVEALSGVCLPRGTGIVTRAPLQLRMLQDSSKSWGGKLHYKKFDKEMVIDLLSPDEVGPKVLEVQMDLTDGNEKAVSETEIRLEVKAQNVPDLTVVDLPGIVRVAGDDQDPDIEVQIKALISKYIKEPNTIILVVCPANVDVAVNESIKFAKQVDPKGERTLGVITKPDLVGRGEESLVLKMVNNESSVKLSANEPWTVVKARSQQDLIDDIPLSKAVEIEEQFFANHSHFKRINKDQRGIQSLAKKLSAALTQRIKSSLPELQRQLNHVTEGVKDELKELGEGPPEDLNDLRTFLLDHVGRYIEHLRSESLGLDRHHSHSACEVNLFATFRQHCEQLAREIDANRPDTPESFYSGRMHEDPIEEPEPKTTEPSPTSPGLGLTLESSANLSDSISSLPGTTKKPKIFKRHSIIQKKKPTLPSTVEVSFQRKLKIGNNDENLLEEIRHQMELRRGSQLPVYEKPAVVEAKIKEFIARCKYPIFNCLEKVYLQVDLEFRKMASHYFQNFPMMENVAQVIISKLGASANQECKIALIDYMEMEGMIFEQDNIYKQELELVASLLKNVSDIEVTPESVDTSHKLSVLIPDVGDWCKNEAKKHLLNLKVYYRIASRRMMEIAPMQIQYMMLVKLSKKVADHMNAHIANSSTEDIMSMGEDPDVAAIRSHIRKKFEDLEKVRKLLRSQMTKDIAILL